MRILTWLYAHLALAWHDWHAARLDHRAPLDQWARIIHRGDALRRQCAQFPLIKGIRPD